MKASAQLYITTIEGASAHLFCCEYILMNSLNQTSALKVIGKNNIENDG